MGDGYLHEGKNILDYNKRKGETEIIPYKVPLKIIEVKFVDTISFSLIY